jgi:peptide/nickel transport system substrate-binding protein
VDPAKSHAPLASSVELRKAFELSLNRKAINDVVFSGQAVPDCVPLPTTSSLRPAGVKCATFDQAAAKKLIKASGQKTPVPVELMIPARPTDQKVGELIQQMANAVGFDVTLKPVEFVSSIAAGQAGNFDMYLIGWSGRIDPDGDLTGILDTGGANNESQLADTKLDNLILAASSASTVKERQAQYAKVLDRIDQIKPIIYLYHDSWFLGTTGLTGVVYSADAIPKFKSAALTK